jgi:hypothetical protein
VAEGVGGIEVGIFVGEMDVEVFVGSGIFDSGAGGVVAELHPTTKRAAIDTPMINKLILM